MQYLYNFKNWPQNFILLYKMTFTLHYRRWPGGISSDLHAAASQICSSPDNSNKLQIWTLRSLHAISTQIMHTHLSCTPRAQGRAPSAHRHKSNAWALLGSS